LQVVAAARQQQHQKEIDHIGDRDLRLADADRLDDDDVEPGGLGQYHGLAGLACHATERARGRGGTDESGGLLGEPAHARLVAEDRAAGALRGRVDGEHGQAVAGGNEVHPKLIDGRGFADAGHARHAKPQRAARRRQQRLQQLLRPRGVLGLGALHQRDGAREHGPVARADSRDVGVERWAGRSGFRHGCSCSVGKPVIIAENRPPQGRHVTATASWHRGRRDSQGQSRDLPALRAFPKAVRETKNEADKGGRRTCRRV